MSEEQYTIAVALFDYLPVALSAFGLHALASALSLTHSTIGLWARAGAWLIPLGGVFKATWKLRIALGYPALDWLENLLFICLAPGFLLVALATSSAYRVARSGALSRGAKPGPLGVLALPAIIGGSLALIYPDTRIWFFSLLALTTLANLWLVIAAYRWTLLLQTGRLCRISLVAAFLGTLALSGFARLPPTEWTAWIQESTNLIIQGLFAWAFWSIYQGMRRAAPFPDHSNPGNTP